jgi:hypothetical protein
LKNKKSPASLIAGLKGGLCEDILTADRVVLGVAVCTPRRDQMDHPTQEPRGSDPRNSSKNQPKNTNEYSAVVNLTNTRNQETQNSGNQWFTHCSNLPPQVNNELERDLLQKVLMPATVSVART